MKTTTGTVEKEKFMILQFDEQEQNILVDALEDVLESLRRYAPLNEMEVIKIYNKISNMITRIMEQTQ